MKLYKLEEAKLRIQYAKVFGERNCGTNFLTHILEDNTSLTLHRHLPTPYIESTIASLPEEMQFVARERLLDMARIDEFKETFGWKHAAVDIDHLRESKHFSSTLFIFIIRNPFSFLNSLYQRPYNHIYKSWSTKSVFLKTPWLCNIRDKVEYPLLENPIQLWNLKNSSYTRANEKHEINSILIRYEDLVMDPDSFNGELKKYCIVQHHQLKIPQESSKQGNDKSFINYYDDVVNYTPDKEFSSDDIDFIASNLDQNLLNKHYPEYL